jgi:hypothetical protein
MKQRGGQPAAGRAGDPFTLSDWAWSQPSARRAALCVNVCWIAVKMPAIQIGVFCAAATSRALWSDLAIPKGECKRVARLGVPPHFAAPERSRLALNTRTISPPCRRRGPPAPTAATTWPGYMSTGQPSKQAVACLLGERGDGRAVGECIGISVAARVRGGCGVCGGSRRLGLACCGQPDPPGWRGAGVSGRGTRWRGCR